MHELPGRPLGLYQLCRNPNSQRLNVEPPATTANEGVGGPGLFYYWKAMSYIIEFIDLIKCEITS